jgi:hypothetical protein
MTTDFMEQRYTPISLHRSIMRCPLSLLGGIGSLLCEKIFSHTIAPYPFLINEALYLKLYPWIAVAKSFANLSWKALG